VLVPHHDVDQDGEDLADVANDGEGGGRNDSPQCKRKVAHAQATNTGQDDRNNPGP